MSVIPDFEFDCSPFDCLGIPCQNYTVKELAQAKKRAVLHVHPDKQLDLPRDGKPWVELRYCAPALAFLSDYIEIAVAQYQGYPQTFDSSVVRGNGPAFDTDDIATAEVPCTQCEECRMVIPQKHYKSHMQRVHSLHQHCQDCTVWCYSQEVESSVHCPSCPSDIVFPATEIEDHIEKQHCRLHCPLCTTSEFINDTEVVCHLAGIHLWRYCGDCVVYIDADTREHHLLQQHEWVPCPFCDILIAAGSLMVHASGSHHLRPCVRCMEWDTPDRQLRHLTADHPAVPCTEPDCRALVPRGDIRGHLVGSHGLVPCLYCDRAYGPNGIEGHMDSAHILRQCQVCSNHIPEDALDTHLQDRHEWVRCSFCNTVQQTVADLVEHLRTEICGACAERGCAGLLQAHVCTPDLVPCGTCGEAVLRIELDAHIGTCLPTPASAGAAAVPANTGNSLHTLQCDGCEMHSSYETIASHFWDAHVAQVEGHRGTCLVCRQTFARVRRHISRVHHLQIRTGTVPKLARQPCPRCNRAVTKVARHIRLVHHENGLA